MAIGETLKKSYFKLPKIPGASTFSLYHVYSIPEFQNCTYTMDNLLALFKSIRSKWSAYRMPVVLEVSVSELKFMPPGRHVTAQEPIAVYATDDVVGTRAITLYNGKKTVLVMKTLYSNGLRCPIVHFFFSSKNSEYEKLSSVSLAINRYINKARSTVITRVEFTDRPMVFVNEKKYNRQMELLDYFMYYIEDAIDILLDSIKYKRIITKNHRNCRFRKQAERILLIKAIGLTDDELRDVLKTVRHLFNLLASLRPFLKQPNAVDIVHGVYPDFMSLVHCYGIERAGAICTPRLTTAAVSFLSCCLKSDEYHFIRKLGPNWTHSCLHFNNYELIEEEVPSCFMTYNPFKTQEPVVEPMMPDISVYGDMNFIDYRIVKASHENQVQQEMSVTVGEFVMILVMHRETCVLQDLHGECGFLTLNYLTPALHVNFYSDSLVSSLYNRMRCSRPISKALSKLMV